MGARERFGWVGLLAAALAATACTTSNPVMTFLFDGVPAPGQSIEAPPVVRQPRRAKYKPPPPPVTWVEVPDIPPPTDWKALRESLPKLEGGEPDWTKALELRLIDPKPGIAKDAKGEDPSDLDVEIKASGQPEWKSVFRHKPHTEWMGCALCHPGLFEMESGKVKMTMAGMGEGQWCGACHGKVASPELTACAACHPAAPK